MPRIKLKKAELDEQKKKKAADDAEAKRNPPRIWVQIATGSNRSGLPITWRKLKSGAPKALEGQSAWFAPFRATNRLVIGPFKSSGEARAMVNRLAKEEITATTWTSDPGEDVTKLGGR
jgi:SPOR domain